MRCAALLLACLLLVLARPARAQLAEMPGRDTPVYYQADTAEYDRERGVATLTGHVEIWQNDRVLLADKVTFNRNTNVAAAIGNVVVLEPDGQTLFSDYAELGDGLKDGVLSGMRALLSGGGRLAANGARRTDARVNELSRAVYSTCDLCPTDPTRAPLWQLRAREAIQDKDNKRIEYRDAVVDIFGIPVFYTPYLTHPDPTEKRASGLLVPTIGYTKRLGAFAAVPYYWAIDPQSDATITPLVGTANGPAVQLEYRRRFNSGSVTIESSLANARGDPAGHLFSRGRFAIDDTWRWGFDLNRASSSQYMRDFQVQNWAPILTSQLYIEGFGQGSYTKLDSRFYQGLTSNVIANKVPFVLPHYQYSFAGERDRLGGRIGVDLGFFNVLRTEGTRTQRGRLSVSWERPAVGRFGDLWNLTLRADSTAYVAQQFDEQPNYGRAQRVDSSQAMPTVAVQWRWPFIRHTSGYGSQTVEPIGQLMAGPRGSSYRRADTEIPNEDSLSPEFTDANLFALNRFPGVDRLEGGVRAAVALRSAWNFPSGARLEGLVGQGYRLKKDTAFTDTSGVQDTASDIVSRVSVIPASWLDLTSRQRFDRRGFSPRFADMLATVGDPKLQVTGGYIYTRTNPFSSYDTAPSYYVPTKPRNEVTAGVSTRVDNWRFGAALRRDLQTAKMVATSLRAGYEDECFAFDVNLFRRFTSLNGDNGATTVLFQITFKTVGQFGFSAK